MEALSISVSVLSLLFSAFQLRFQIVKANHYQQMAKEMAGFRKEKLKFSESVEELTKLLSVGDMILPQLRLMVFRRMQIVAFAIGSLFLLWIPDFSLLAKSSSSEQIMDWSMIENLSNWTIFFLQIAIVGFSRIKLFEEHEKTFIKYFGSLNDDYYNLFVTPTIKSFNSACNDNSFFRLEKENAMSMNKQLKKDFEKWFAEAKKTPERD